MLGSVYYIKPWAYYLVGWAMGLCQPNSPPTVGRERGGNRAGPTSGHSSLSSVGCIGVTFWIQAAYAEPEPAHY